MLEFNEPVERILASIYLEVRGNGLCYVSLVKVLCNIYPVHMFM